MLATLIATSLLLQNQDSHSLVNQVTPQITGQNGYEEYVMAAEIARSKKLSIVASQDLTPLARAKKYHAEIEPIFRLIQTGNKKDVFKPGKMSADALFPELSYFRTIFRALGESAYFEVANGNANRGMSMILEGVKFTEKLDQTLISYLVGNAGQAILLVQIQTLLPRLPMAELARLEDFAPQTYSTTRRIEQTLENEMTFSIESLKEAVRDPKKFTETMGMDNSEEGDNFSKDFLSKTQSEREEMLRSFESNLISKLTKMKQMLKGPEASWKETFDEESSGNELADIILPVYANVFSSEARIRTQWRLMRLASRVEKFRWDRGVLPSQLSDCAPADWLLDPLSNRPFQFAAKNQTEYELFSEGALGLGRIDIKYQRIATDERELEP